MSFLEARGIVKSYPVGGLTANTTYHYQMIVTDTTGSTRLGADVTFRTP